ncbi:methyltransferase family protein [Psychromonas aquimarina]|uniref:methyltransferase family protein n=1 Tax=Psychromonas aquimarina TaxID=444919 RepID=UPI000403B02A|nr:isoprenylcysteine carboxylmethyltransferase family protein [Psychromonas aquimarina]
MIRTLFKLPVFFVLLLTVLMFTVDRALPTFSYLFPCQTAVSAVLCSVGMLVVLSAGHTFRKAGTTVDPRAPEKASHLVCTGIYAYSRNPMYAGAFSCLAALVVFLGNPLNLLLLPVYVYFADKLYIIPEERALLKLFGPSFTSYKAKVRRWF